MLRTLCLTLTFCALCTGVRAQGQISIDAAEGIQELMDLFLDTNEAETKVEGWRVQILATTDRNRLTTVEDAFKANYPSVPVDWVHNKPYYKLRAGAFQTKAEAEQLKSRLSAQFEGVYLVKDQVRESELLRMY